jgi:hypothetical protein
MSADALTQPAPRTVWRDDFVAALTGGLLILGLFLDGWNHLNLQQGKAGDFLTPWHGLLYAGFNACAIWAITRNTRLRSMMFPSRAAKGAGAGARRAPQFNTAHVALLGLGLAAAGVIGDAVARTAGLVSDTGAMQAPFDFLLFTGAALMLAIALRSVATQVEGFGKRFLVPAVVGIGGAAAVVIAFGGPAATKSVDHVVRTIAAQPSVSQSAPRTLPAARHHARHAAASRTHAHHRAAAGTHARHASHGAATIAASATASATHHSSSSTHHASRTVVVHRRASRHAAAAPHRRSVARPAPHRRATRSKGRFQQVAIPDVPGTSNSSSPSAPASSAGSSSGSSGSSGSSPAASPTAAPTPTTSNPPASSPPATPPTAAKHGGPGQG